MPRPSGHTTHLPSEMSIKGLFQIAIGPIKFFLHMGQLPTNEQLEAWRHKPVLYQQPGPRGSLSAPIVAGTELFQGSLSLDRPRTRPEM
jgi:hypothetical protein